MKNNAFPRLITAATLAALFSASAPSHAQTSGSDSSPKSSSSASGGQVSKGDQELMEDIAHANLAEVETGKLALEKSKNEQVRQFAQKMIDDHSMAMKDLQKLAQSKDVTLPTETDVQHKTMATALKALSGDTFDNQYIERVGVGDHQRTHDLLQKTIKNAKDPDLKAYAQKTVKTVDQHLAMAKKLEAAKK